MQATPLHLLGSMQMRRTPTCHNVIKEDPYEGEEEEEEAHEDCRRVFHVRHHQNQDA